MINELKERKEHIAYILEKSEKTRKRWKKIMQASGKFSDFEESLPIKSNSDSSKPTKQAPSKDTTTIDVQTKKYFEALDKEVHH